MDRGFFFNFLLKKNINEKSQVHPRSVLSLDIALVLSRNNFLHVWTVTSPHSDWALCDSPVAMTGNICKYKVKAFKLIHLNIEELLLDGSTSSYAFTYNFTYGLTNSFIYYIDMKYNINTKHT